MHRAFLTRSPTVRLVYATAARRRSFASGTKQARSRPFIDPLTGEVDKNITRNRFDKAADLIQFERDAVRKREQRRKALLDAQPSIPMHVQEALSANPGKAGEVLRQCVSDDITNLPIIRTCLQTAREHLSSGSGKSSDAAATRQQSSLVRIMLECVWRDTHIWSSLALQDESTLVDLCWIAICEDLEPSIAHWMEMETPLDESHFHGSKNGLWRGVVLRALVEAHLEHNIYGSADAAIKCFMRVRDRKYEVVDDYKARRDSGHDSLPPGIYYMSLWPASVRLATALSSLTWPKTGLQPFDDFTSVISNPGPKIDYMRTRRHVAELILYHPKRPDAIKAVKYYREFFGSTPSEIRTTVAAMDSKYKRNMHRRLQRALYLTERAGVSEDATWLKSILQQYFADVQPPGSNMTDRSGSLKAGDRAFRRLLLESHK